MRLTFRKLVISDFKEYIGKHILNLTSLGLGVHFVRGVNEVDPELGSNGASKSTIFDALRWCLFGSTVKGLKNPDVKTWGGKNTAVVKLYVEVGTRRHLIRRSTKTNGLSIDDLAASQEGVERLIGMNSVMFDHVILMGQGEDLFLDLSPTPKLNVLSETLDLERWDRRSVHAKREKESAESEATRIKYLLAGLEDNLVKREDDLKAEKERMADWEKARSDRDEARGVRISELRKQLEKLDKVWGKYDLAYDYAETELRASRKRQQDLLDQRGELASQEVVFINSIEALEKTMKSGDKCPTCGQKLPGDHKDLRVKKAKELKKLEAEYDELLDKRSDVDESVEKIKKEISGFIEASNDAQDGMTRTGSQRAEVKAELSQLTKNGRIDDDRDNPYAEAVAKYRSDIKELSAEIADLKKKQNKYERRALRLHEWVGYFKQIRLYLLQEALEELEAETNLMLPTVGLNGWSISYDIERETKAGKVTPGLTVSILKPTMSKPVRWESWSGGEAQRLRLTASIALSKMLLRRAGLECDTLILDEPTQHLSPEGVRDTASLLCDLGDSNQIFFVDHQAVESNRFSSVITVTKTTAGASFAVDA